MFGGATADPKAMVREWKSKLRSESRTIDRQIRSALHLPTIPHARRTFFAGRHVFALFVCPMSAATRGRKHTTVSHAAAIATHAREERFDGGVFLFSPPPPAVLCLRHRWYTPPAWLIAPNM
jgi:hypothetical protein